MRVGGLLHIMYFFSLYRLSSLIHFTHNEVLKDLLCGSTQTMTRRGQRECQYKSSHLQQFWNLLEKTRHLNAKAIEQSEVVCAQGLKHREHEFSKGRACQCEVARKRLLQFQGSLVRINKILWFLGKKIFVSQEQFLSVHFLVLLQVISIKIKISQTDNLTRQRQNRVSGTLPISSRGLHS